MADRKPFARRIIVHLGLAKTGTTILQESAFAYRERLLAEHDILYPSNGVNHFHFQSVVSDAPELLIQMRREGITTREEARARASEFLAAFEAELIETAPQTVLISSEYFSSMSRSELLRLYELLSGYAEEIWAVAYMRDPWSYSASIVQQHVRDGRLEAPIQFGYFGGPAKFLRVLDSVFVENLIIRPYFGGGPHRTNIVEDFCEVIGISRIPECASEGPAANRSIGHVRMTLIAELNRIWPQFDKNGVYVHSIERNFALQWLLDLPLQDRPIVLTKRQVEVIQRVATDDMDYVESRHFGGNRLFTDYMVNETPPERDHTISLEKLDADDLREIVRATLEAQMIKQKKT